MRSIICGAVAVAIASSWVPAHACGDKFMLLGRGMSFQRAYAALHPGQVVVYVEDAAGADARTKDFRKLLARAGHTVRLAAGRAELERLRLEPADIVIASTSQSTVLTDTVASLAPPPAVLLVLMDKDKKAAAAAPDTEWAWKQSDGPAQILRIVDATMKQRIRSGARVKRG
jgi:hypothetical protein